MFEKFDDKSIKTIMLAQEEARRLSHNFVGTEQILLGIIAEGTNLASKALRDLGISLKNARLEVHKIIGSGSDNVGKEVPFTPRAKKLLDNSVKVGLILKHKEVRPEHLLLGLIIQDEGVGIKVLENLGVGRSVVVKQIFSAFASQGDESAVERFSEIAAQVEPDIVETDSEQYIESLSEEEIEVYLQFLIEILKATGDSRGSSQVVYPLLEKNIDKLNKVFKEVLHRWGTAYLEELKVEEKRRLYTAATIVLSSNLIRRFSLGNKASNMEIAITGYKVALTVFTQQAFRENWAETQNNLGLAYRDRIAGERAENLEQAITCFQEALKFHTFEAFPYKWSGTQNNLGSAYLERIAGERAENLEQAITCFQEALKFHTFEAFPSEWAVAQNNLGLAYINRIKGQDADNFKQAITCFQEALKVRTFEAFRENWAETQNNLGLAYINIFRKGQYEYLGQAIPCFQEALKVYTFEASPLDWAMTQNNLGIAHYYLYYVYRNIIEDEESENLGQENLEQAMTCFQEALKVYTFEASPLDWAMTQNNLAGVLGLIIKGNRAKNLQRAVVCYQEVLKVHTFEAFPQKYTEGLLNLGAIYQEAKQFDLAYTAFTSVITNVEFLWSEIFSGEESKRKQAEHFHQCYGRIIEVCLELGNIKKAIEYVERSKTQTLIGQMLERDSASIFPAEVVTQLEKYKYQIATEQYQIQNGKTKNLQSKVKHLQELRQHHNELQSRYLRIGAGFNFDSFQATLDERTGIVEWFIHKDKILVFIFTPKGKITVWQSQTQEFKTYCDWVDKYLQNYNNQKDHWRNNLGKELEKLASFLHIDEILRQLPKSCDQLILIPHRELHLFPLHALPVAIKGSENPACLLDLFARGVRYAPSCQILQQVQQRQRPDLQSLFAIQNPTEDLDYADLEVDSILNLFSSHQVLPYKQATKATLLQQMPQIKEVNCLHFSCHGSFNFESPQDSCLKLAESVGENDELDLSKCLTLSNLFEREFQLDNCRLVILSACETGLIDFTNISDEYIGLPSGFLYAGSTSVVSSLWTVDDVSTALLIIRFYQNIKNGLTVAVALNQAQIWLRDATTVKLQAWASKLQLTPEEAENIEASLDWFDSDEQPFQDPYWWSGFCAMGN